MACSSRTRRASGGARARAAWAAWDQVSSVERIGPRTVRCRVESAGSRALLAQRLRSAGPTPTPRGAAGPPSAGEGLRSRHEGQRGRLLRSPPELDVAPRPSERDPSRPAGVAARQFALLATALLGPSGPRTLEAEGKPTPRPDTRSRQRSAVRAPQGLRFEPARRADSFRPPRRRCCERQPRFVGFALCPLANQSKRGSPWRAPRPSELSVAYSFQSHSRRKWQV